ncbi:MAG TPA: amidohydrolase family protein [Acidimicrobiia bacterium]|nr:amidohydrolase family protein [Acidimicrobiia bacterium]
MSDADLVVRGATVVDGRGGPPFAADVGVTGGVITAIGTVGPGGGAEELDGRGLVLAPGFIDAHTHLDANLFWDPDLTPSSSFGVTTVVTGNCGYALAPLGTGASRDYVVETLSEVEQIPIEAIRAGVPLDWSTLDDYFARLDSTPALLNFATHAGHVPIRTAVMGPDAVHDRTATPDEIERMSALLRHALELGALGVTTDQVVGNVGPRGTQLPGQVCSDDELLAFARVLASASGPGWLAMAPRALLLDRAAREDDLRFHERLAAASAKPVVIGPCFDHFEQPGVGFDLIEATARSRRPGVTVVPQVSVFVFELWQRLDDNPLLVRVLPTLRRAVRDDGVDGLRRVAADPAARSRLRDEARAITPFPVFSGRWDHVFVRQVVDGARFGALVDRDLATLAREQGVEPVDVLLDTAIAEDFATQFSTLMRNTDDDEIGRMLAHPLARIGASDAGAHVLSNTDSAYAVWTLQHWCRERGVLTLERAVQMLTADQADLLGMPERGRIAVGQVADLVLFDPDRIARTGVRFVADQPAGGRRLVSEATGVAASVVNGVVATRDGHSTGARSGRFLRATSREWPSPRAQRAGRPDSLPPRVAERRAKRARP